MLDLDVVEDAIKSEPVRAALNDLMVATSGITRAEESAQWAARQVAEAEAKMRKARSELAMARAKFSAAIANEARKGGG